MAFHKLIELFCSLDDFCKIFSRHWHSLKLEDGLKHRNRKKSLCLSEILTILVGFHSSGFRDFKHFFFYLKDYHQRDFPGLPSYNRFVEWIPETLLPLMLYLHTLKAKSTGLNFVDSTALKVCNNKRIFNHKVFAGLAQRGKTTMGYFFGFKLHIAINECGELLAFQLTPGNTDDRVPVPKLTQKLWGKLFGDKGYLSQKLFDELFKKGIRLITSVKNNMKNKLLPLLDKILLRKRSIIESVNDQLKNVCQIEHSRHRSPVNFLVNTITALIAYCHQDKKPSLSLNLQNQSLPMSPVAF